MRTDHSKSLLEDPELQALVKAAILEKVDRYEALKKEREDFLELNACNKTDEASAHFLEKVYDILVGGSEILQLEKDLNRLCFLLVRATGHADKRSTQWEEAFNRAKYQTSIEEIASRYLNIENYRRNVVCPFHEDKSPSMKFYPKKNLFLCFGCGARGSPIDFVMKIENCTFQEAVFKISNL